ncbi:LapA family protein [Companilactobacillus sp. DQM5]|uniref:LapA family protein n=1 Tax=Companilactobacillus sp. DQM5 TaxID=3463359 RepID=UPI0040590C53
MTKKQAKFFLSILLILIVVIFSVMNTEAVTINFLFTKVNLPLIILIIVTFILGAITSYLFSFGNKNIKKEDKKIPADDKKIKKVENTIENK